MNRDPAHPPLPTEPFSPRTTSRLPPRPISGTSTQPVEQADVRPPAATERAPTVLAPTVLAPESAQDDTPGHTLRLSQLEALSALMEAELRKSDPLAATEPVDHSPPPAPSANSDEESLQTYLDRFMERVTGKKPVVSPPAAPIAPAVASPPIAPVASPSVAPIDTQPIVPQPITAQPIISQSQPIFGASPQQPPAPLAPLQSREPVRAPECREQISAMRDLANENLRTAMNTHAGRHQWRRTKAAFLLAIVATTISSVLAVWNLLAAAPGTAESAACTGLIAVYLACRFYWRSRSLAALI